MMSLWFILIYGDMFKKLDYLNMSGVICR
jgi:hypothetical protein